MSAEQTRTPDEERLQAELRELAQEIAGSLSAVDAASGRELLSDFVSELFFCVTEQQRREDRRQGRCPIISTSSIRRGGRGGFPSSRRRRAAAWPGVRSTTRRCGGSGRPRAPQCDRAGGMSC